MYKKRHYLMKVNEYRMTLNSSSIKLIVNLDAFLMCHYLVNVGQHRMTLIQSVIKLMVNLNTFIEHH